MSSTSFLPSLSILSHPLAEAHGPENSLEFTEQATSIIDNTPVEHHLAESEVVYTDKLRNYIPVSTLHLELQKAQATSGELSPTSTWFRDTLPTGDLRGPTMHNWLNKVNEFRKTLYGNYLCHVDASNAEPCAEFVRPGGRIDVRLRHMNIPSFAEIHECFLDVRAYYKDGLKSNNKYYYPYDGYSAKGQRRHINTVLSGHIAVARVEQENREEMCEEETALIRGQELYETRATDGNCGSMNDVAVFVINSRFPNVELHNVVMNEGAPIGDHALLVCGSSPPDGKQINEWKNYNFESDSYAIDVWMNICCRSNDYMLHAASKLDKWTADGKVIITENWLPARNGTIRGEMVVPNSELYRQMLFDTPIEFDPVK